MLAKLHRAFTLIEILVVIVIIATLLALLYPSLTSGLEKAKVTKDMSNLRQIGLATQTYLNDNDGAFFLPGSVWMNSLHPKYLSNWKSFQSPFDNRAASESNTSAPVSYGFDANAAGVDGSSLLAEQITNPSAFILFAPAQASGTTVTFSGISAGPVRVVKDGSTPGGTAVGGTHNKRQRINACMADLHVENMAWSDFITDTGTPTAPQRWNPTATPAP